MNTMLISLKSLFLGSLFLINACSYALDSAALEAQADIAIKALYHRVNSMPNTSMQERIEWFSNHFKGVEYVLGSLGEGPSARYDQYPRYRVNGFDCDTYVNTVLALALAHSLDSFKQCINLARYKNGKVSYITRNHFTSIDWNELNQHRGVLKDITETIKNQDKKSAALYAVATIDKSGWYAYKKSDVIRLQKDDTALQAQRLQELKKKGSRLGRTVSKVPYIPLTILFNQDKQPDMNLFAQIPHGSIIEIVRPNWDLHKEIGTNLNISHLGFAIRDNDTLYFRQASSHYGKVVDVLMVDYLRDALSSPTIKGINIQVVVPTKPVC